MGCLVTNKALGRMCHQRDPSAGLGIAVVGTALTRRSRDPRNEPSQTINRVMPPPASPCLPLATTLLGAARPVHTRDGKYQWINDATSRPLLLSSQAKAARTGKRSGCAMLGADVMLGQRAD